MQKKNSHLIVMTGGGTAGPVAPLLAVCESLRNKDTSLKFLFIGTKTGPEQSLVESAGIPFRAVSAGKLRRYWSPANLLSPFLVIAGFFQAFFILYRERPLCCLGASGFVQVPVLWAAWVLRIPVVIHQQDVLPSLANTLCSPIATKITTSFEASQKDFFQGLGVYKDSAPVKVVWTGNPVRGSLKVADRQKSLVAFGLDSRLPTVLVFGGGTGATGINKIIEESYMQLGKFCQIIHVTGRGKTIAINHPHYHQIEFTTDMAALYAASDLVIARAGMSTISELAFLGKVALIIPMPNSHQEDNAALLWGKHAAYVLDQSDFDCESFVRMVRTLLIDQKVRATLQENIRLLMPSGAADAIADIILKVVHLKIFN